MVPVVPAGDAVGLAAEGTVALGVGCAGPAEVAGGPTGVGVTLADDTGVNVGGVLGIAVGGGTGTLGREPNTLRG